MGRPSWWNNFRFPPAPPPPHSLRPSTAVMGGSRRIGGGGGSKGLLHCRLGSPVSPILFPFSPTCRSSLWLASLHSPLGGGPSDLPHPMLPWGLGQWGPGLASLAGFGSQGS